MFVTFEGVEGSGKSTLMQGVAASLELSGAKVCVTFEPGGTELGQIIRSAILDGHAAASPLAELMLFAADRAQHVREVIAPALARGEVVLCDRFSDSSYAYQSESVSPAVLSTVDSICAEGLAPDLTVLLDTDVRSSLARARSRPRPDRFESLHDDFHERVRERYLARASQEPERFLVLPAFGDVDAVVARIRAMTAEA